MLIKITAALLFTMTAFAAKDYENFDLPKGAKATVPESALNYKSNRIEFKEKGHRTFVPSVSHEAYLTAREEFITEKRDEKIKLLRQQMDSGYKVNRDNMLLQLGQLYAEKYMELSYHENELYSKELQDHEAKKAAPKITNDKSLKRPVIDNSRSQSYLKDALKLFGQMEKEYPKHPKIDEVLYFIGFVEMESSGGKKGQNYLERVIRQYPQSRKFDEAVVYLGDFYFDHHKFREAIGKFQILGERKDAPLHDYAMYKLAWCHLNTEEQTKGLHEMKELIARLKGVSEKAKFNLREQALKDLVIFYGEVEAVDEAVAYFTEVQGKDKALENLKLIADILRSKARDDAAIKAYHHLLSEYGDSIEAPNLSLGLYESESRIGKTDKAVADLITLMEKYNPKSSWAESFSDDKRAQVKSALDAIAEEGKRAALFHHHSAQKSSNKAAFDYAQRLYSALIEYFPEHPDHKLFAFYRADILYNEEKWNEAADSYMAAAKIPPKDKVTDECVYDALLSLDHLTAKADSLERYTKDQQKSVDTTPEEIPAHEKHFIEVANYYLAEYPKGERVVEVQFRIAAINYRHRHFDEALEGFKKIAMEHPTHKTATTSAHLVLDIYNIQKDYDKLNAAAKEFAATGNLGDAEFKAELAGISGEVDFKRVDELEKGERWKEAADSYYEFYQKQTSHPLAEKALYNSYILYQKAGQTSRAQEVSQLFIAKFPKSEYTAKFVLGLAVLAEKQYDFESAEKLYYDFYKKFPTHAEAHKALFNSAVMAELLEKNKDAMARYDEYLKTKVSESEKRAITISQAKIYRKEGNWTKFGELYHKLVANARNANEKFDFLGELARQYERAGRATDFEKTLNEIRWMHKEHGGKLNGAGMYYVAQAQFKALDADRKKYEAMKLRFPAEDLVFLIKKKEKALTKLAAEYDGVVALGVPEWGLAALLEKSQAFESFVAAFKAVQIPKHLKGDALEEAQKGMKVLEAQVVEPLKGKEKEILEACASKAAEYHVASEYAGKCKSRLAANDAASTEPSGLIPQPSYFSTRFQKDEVAAK